MNIRETRSPSLKLKQRYSGEFLLLLRALNTTSLLHHTPPWYSLVCSTGQLYNIGTSSLYYHGVLNLNTDSSRY
jgi:hypothetical protein